MEVPFVELFETFLRIRRVEQKIAEIYPTDKIKSPVHLSIGQEAVSVGVCAALCPRDVVFGTYRGHALYLAKGGDLKAMIAELYGKITGCGRGKAGSMHLVDVACGMMGTSAVVGTTIPNAVGYAYAMSYLDSDQVVVSFFGDGAVEEGVFSESLNFAYLKKLPVLFVCENNRYAIHSEQAARQANLDLVGRAASFGIPGRRIENNDIEAIYKQSTVALEEIRSGEGPFFLECMTYRWLEHVGPNEDYDLGYRSRQEAEEWIAGDPLPRLAECVPAAERKAIEAAIEEEIQEAFAFAEESEFPDSSELHRHLFK